MTAFDQDLFISYAHIDNQPLTPDQSGWISRFHSSLETFLSMRLGQSASIWRDDKLQGNDVFADEIVDQFGRTAVFVSVVTPRYLNSEWCAREATEFCQQAEKNGGVVVENKARIFKILKMPLDSEAPLPDVMRQLLGYEFYTLDDGTPIELDAAYGEKFGQDYNRKVSRLAFDISQMLQSLKADVIESQPSDTATEKCVYLAECSYDLKENRESLAGELQCLGYQVLPDKPLPHEEDDYQTAVEEMMSRCKLSIHLIGENLGAVVDGPSHNSVSELQNSCAALHSRKRGMRRLIWLRAGTSSQQPQQQNFIEALHLEPEAQFGADLLTGELEDLKTSMYARLNELDNQSDDSDSQGSDGAVSPLVYLICTNQDRKQTIPLRKHCRDLGFDVSLPAFEGDAASVREANRQLMRKCSVILIFYGCGEEAWKRTIDNELKKLMSYRDEAPLPLCITCLASPHSEDKEDLVDMEEANLIDGTNGFSESQLKQLGFLLKSEGMPV